MDYNQNNYNTELEDINLDNLPTDISFTQEEDDSQQTPVTKRDKGKKTKKDKKSKGKTKENKKSKDKTSDVQVEEIDDSLIIKDDVSVETKIEIRDGEVDLITPSTIVLPENNHGNDYAIIDGKYIKIFYIHKYPAIVDLNVTQTIFNMSEFQENGVDIAINIEDVSDTTQKIALEQKMKENYSLMMADNISKEERIRATDEYNKNKEEFDNLVRNSEGVNSVMVTFKIVESSLEALIETSDDFIQMMADKDFVVKTMFFKVLDGYLMTTPIGKNALGKAKINYSDVLTKELTSTLFPFRKKDVIQKGGINMGVNLSTGNLVSLKLASFNEVGEFKPLENNGMIIVGTPGSGKAQPLDMIIPTPNGNKRFGDLKIGDFVFDRLGQPTRILEIYPQGEIDEYEITFSDERKTFCNEEHLWTCLTAQKTFNTLPLSDMIENGIKTLNNKAKYKIPLNSPVEYSSNTLELDPYVFGVFLGNRCKNGQALQLPENDEFIIEEIATLMDWTYKRVSDNLNDYRFTYKTQQGLIKPSDDDNHTNKYVKDAFDNMKKLSLLKNDDKIIPQEYLYSSIENRLSLLQGLFDVDGQITKSGKVTFTSNYKHIVENVQFLLNSLGYSSNIKEINALDDKASYLLNVDMPNADKQSLFRLPRKKDKAVKIQDVKQRKKYDGVYIKEVRKTGRKVAMQCIAVDNPEHLYLCNDFIVTHNTYTSQKIIFNYVLKRVHFAILDSENEFNDITTLLGGRNVIFKHGSSENMINLFNISEEEKLNEETNEPERVVNPQTGHEEIVHYVNLSGKVSKLKQIITAMIEVVQDSSGVLSPEQNDILVEAIRLTYKRFGITTDPNSLYQENTDFDNTTLANKVKKAMPTFTDLVTSLAIILEEYKPIIAKAEKSYDETLKYGGYKLEDFSRLYTYLKPFIKGGQYEMFDTQSQIDIDAWEQYPIINFNISAIREDAILNNILTMIVMDWMQYTFLNKKQAKRKCVLIDEAHRYLKDKTSENVVREVYNITDYTIPVLSDISRAARKRNGFMILITQSLKEFMDKKTEDILQYTPNKIIHKYGNGDTVSINELVSALNINQNYANIISNWDKSDKGVYYYESLDVSIFGQVRTTDFEHKLIYAASQKGEGKIKAMQEFNQHLESLKK